MIKHKNRNKQPCQLFNTTVNWQVYTKNTFRFSSFHQVISWSILPLITARSVFSATNESSKSISKGQRLLIATVRLLRLGYSWTWQSLRPFPVEQFNDGGLTTHTNTWTEACYRLQTAASTQVQPAASKASIAQPAGQPPLRHLCATCSKRWKRSEQRRSLLCLQQDTKHHGLSRRQPETNTVMHALIPVQKHVFFPYTFWNLLQKGPQTSA